MSSNLEKMKNKKRGVDHQGYRNRATTQKLIRKFLEEVVRNDGGRDTDEYGFQESVVPE